MQLFRTCNVVTYMILYFRYYILPESLPLENLLIDDGPKRMGGRGGGGFRGGRGGPRGGGGGRGGRGRGRGGPRGGGGFRGGPPRR